MKKKIFTILLGGLGLLSYSPDLLAQESFGPTDDTFIFWANSKPENHGSDENLVVRFTTDGAWRRDIFVKFDISAATVNAPYKKVTLKLYGNDEGIVGVPIRILKIASGISNFDWSENSLIFSNKPATDWNADNIAEIETIGDAEDKFFEWDVTEWVNSEKANSKNVVAFHVRQMGIPGTSNAPVELMKFHSKENPSGNKPLLVLTPTSTVGIEDNINNEPSIMVKNGLLSIENIIAENVEIYSLSGILILKNKIDNNGLDVSGLKGLHVVKAGAKAQLILF